MSNTTRTSPLIGVPRQYDFEAKRFYRGSLAFPADIDMDSPLARFAVEIGAAQSPPHRISEDTSNWFEPGKRAAPHPFYLVEYEKATGVAVVLLCCSSPPVQEQRFLRIHGGQGEAPEGYLETIPTNGFVRTTYVNISHPLRVRLIYLGGHGGLGAAKNLQWPVSPPPQIGAVEWTTEPNHLLRLTEQSEETLWAGHNRYQRARPKKAASAPQASETPKESSDPSSPDDFGPPQKPAGTGVPGMPHVSAAPTSTAPDGRPDCGTRRAAEYVGPTDDAPWGRYGRMRVGIDVPLIAMDPDYDSEDEDDEILQKEEAELPCIYVTHDDLRGMTSPVFVQ